MKVGERRFERCIVEAPDRISFNSVSEVSQKKFRCAPLRRAILELSALASLGSF